MTGPAAAGVAERFFAELYRQPPEGVWFAPGRVNFIGEHTDYNGGFVLPFALGAGVTAAAARRDDGVIAVASRQTGGGIVTARLDALAPGLVTGWAAYPLGIAWALRRAGYPAGGVSVSIDSDVAPGAGLSSSAALECAVALALADLWGLAIARPELAGLASSAENDFVGAPTGIMDQSAALLSQADHALLLDCRSGARTAVPLAPGRAGFGLLVINTRVPHALTSGGYAARRRSCEQAAAALGVPSLRDVTDADAILGLADPLLRRRAMHVITENRRTLAAADLLRGGHLARTGPLLTASHASLRDDFEVSWPEADATVEAALEAGAAGARMMGGGFGGSVLALVPSDRAAGVQAAVAARFAEHGWPAPVFQGAVPSGSACRLR